MAEGVQTTLAIMAASESEAATRVLVAVLDSRFRAIRHGAFQAVLARSSPAGHREIIARLHTIDPEERCFLEETHGRMTSALRGAILDRGEQVCVNGCQAAVWFRQYDLIPALLNALEGASAPRAALLGRTLMDLVEQLSRELAAPHQRARRRDPQWVLRQVVGSLELSIHRYGKHRRREVVEALALLAHRDDRALKQILDDPHHPAFVVLLDVLSKSVRGPVLRLLLSYLDDSKAPSAAISVVAKRSDLEFVKHLLGKIGHDPSPVVAQNLKRMESVAWACGGAALLDHLDEASQCAAIWLVMLSGTPRASAFAVVKHLLLHGKPGGRRAAAEAIEQFHGAEANALATEAIDDDDPEVQARVLAQLRGRGIAGALIRLIEMLDSPHAVVRKAARRSLAEFTFSRFLASYDLLDDEVRQSTGALVRKVDPHAVPLLEAELASRIRTRRLRAISVACTLDLIGAVEGPVTRLLQDEDHVVRSEAAAALARGQSAASLDALRAATADRSPIVREAAQKALAQRARAQAAWPPADAPQVGKEAPR